MNISKLSKETGTSIRSLRYYEEKKLLVPNRLKNGYRDFEALDIERVKKIQLYLALGLTTNDIASIIDCPASLLEDKPLCKKSLNLYKKKLKEIENNIILLQTLKVKLKNQIFEFEKGDKKYDY